jgi:hypothetical protein
MAVKKCDFKVVSSSGEKSGSSVDGVVKIQQICTNSKLESSTITTIEASVFGGKAYLTSAQIDRAG